MKKGVNKRDLDQRKREDEVAAAKAFQEYVQDFQDTQSGAKALNKTWVKAGVYEAGKKYEDNKDKKLYKPTSRFEKGETLVSPSTPKDSSNSDDSRPDRLGKKKEKGKKKSNLEIFKDELKLIQEEREERHRLKNMLGLQEVIKLPPKPGDAFRASLSLELDDVKMGSIDDGDPNTTNLYLGNLPTKVTEQSLMELFGKFGPLASVKVMWPRTEEEKARNRLSGFVAFMSRRDGERALKHLAGKEICGGTEVKMGWGKAVPVPAFPIYVPPAMLELTMPPPLSGLPFNAQPTKSNKHKVPPFGTPYPTDPKGIQEFQKLIQNCVVKVVPPTDRSLLALIHRMVEFVSREGPMFEAMVMNREISNPQYRFLFENQGPAHTYYRWKLFSVLQGDPVHRWRTEEFRMFLNGSIWKPPALSPYTQGMPEELIPEDEREIRKGTLSNAQRDRLERMLRRIKPDKHRVAEVMIFCVEHSESVDEICQTLKESLSNPKTTLQKKIARLYVISDILANSGAKGLNAGIYRKSLKNILPSVFQELHYSHQTGLGSGGSSAECFKERVLSCFRAWEDWEIFPKDFLICLQNIFLGITTLNSREHEAEILAGVEDNEDKEVKLKRKSPPRATMPPKSALNLVRAMQTIEPCLGRADDIDGIPYDEEEDIDGVPMPEEDTSTLSNQPTKGSFVPSKWETVDPEEVKAQAVTTTSKWDLFEEAASVAAAEVETQQNIGIPVEDEEDIDGVPMEEEDESQESTDYSNSVRSFSAQEEMSEELRNKLREVENKVLDYEDDLESGRRKIPTGESMSRAIQQYRESLLRKIERERYKREENDDDYESSSRRHRKSRSEWHGNSEERNRNSRHEEERRKKRASPSSSRDYYEEDERGSRSSNSYSSSKDKRKYSQQRNGSPKYSSSSHYSSRNEKRSRSRSPHHRSRHNERR